MEIPFFIVTITTKLNYISGNIIMIMCKLKFLWLDLLKIVIIFIVKEIFLKEGANIAQLERGHWDQGHKCRCSMRPAELIILVLTFFN